MVTEYPGNAIPAPSLRQGNNSVDDELLYSTIGYTQKGVTLKPGQGVLLLGTFLKKDSSTKYYVKTTDAASAEGLLRATLNTGNSEDSPIYQANIVVTGIVKLQKVKAANSGATISNFVASRVNETMGTFKF